MSTSTSSNPFILLINWQETPKAHIIKCDVPRMKVGDELDIKAFDDGSLEISGECVVEAEEEKMEFESMMKLPENANLVEFEADLNYSVLTVTVPKKLPDVMVVESSKGSDDGCE